MSENDAHANESTALEHLDDRDRRALEEHISVLPDVGKARGAPGLFLVVGQHGGGEYLVDVETGACSCPDAEYNLPTDGGRETCKHVAAARFATGRREIPAPVTPADVRDDLAEHVDASPTFAVVDDVSTPAYTAADVAVATDGGTVVELDDAPPADRPDDCQCHPGWDDDMLPCFACWSAGFDAPNPDGPATLDTGGAD
jgi:predicted nucleic acid-binding Zn finger protein